MRGIKYAKVLPVPASYFITEHDILLFILVNSFEERIFSWIELGYS
jgi:hypothetical protein